MVAIAIGVGVGTLVDDGWEHNVLVLEALEIIAFLVYWVVQTREHWNGGVPPSPAGNVSPSRMGSCQPA